MIRTGMKISPADWREKIEANPDFVEIPRFIVINKADLIQKLASVKKIFPKTEKVYFVSAAEETGLKQLMAGAAKRLGV